MSDIKKLMENWAGVIDDKEYAPIADVHKRQVMAQLLENQHNDSFNSIRKDPTLSLTYLTESTPTNVMGASSSTASDGAVDLYDPVMISLIRRSMPNLIAYDICGVQPMSMPSGLVFALRARYGSQSGPEALFNEANTTFASSASGNTASVTAVGDQTGQDPSTIISTGAASYTYGKGMSTAALEQLGSGTDNEWNQMALSLEKVTVTATGMALKGSYSHELAQDFKATQNLDADTEIANMLSTNIMAEMNRQVVRSIYTTATIGAQVNTASAGTFDLDVDSNGRWSVERFKGLMFQIEREANEISKATRAGKGNFIITSSDVASALNMAGILDPTPALQSNLQVDDTGNTFAGVLFGRIKVFIDPYFVSAAGSHFVVVGYKGTSPYDAGMFYCPYVPLQLYKTVDSQTLQPVMGFKTRYGMVAHPFATDAADGIITAAKKNKYYRLFRINNLS